MTQLKSPIERYIEIKKFLIRIRGQVLKIPACQELDRLQDMIQGFEDEVDKEEKQRWAECKPSDEQWAALEEMAKLNQEMGLYD